MFCSSRFHMWPNLHSDILFSVVLLIFGHGAVWASVVSRGVRIGGHVRKRANCWRNSEVGGVVVEFVKPEAVAQVTILFFLL